MHVYAEAAGSEGLTELPRYTERLNIGDGKPFPGQLPAEDEYAVGFDGAHDPLSPKNWKMTEKYIDFVHRVVSRLLILSLQIHSFPDCRLCYDSIVFR